MGVAVGVAVAAAIAGLGGRKAGMLLLLDLQCSNLPASACGQPSHNGSDSLPWDLQTALTNSSALVLSGDTIWLKAGVYEAPFAATAAVSGVVVRSINRVYPAIVDGVNAGESDNFVVAGNSMVIWGIEFTNTSPLRSTSNTSDHHFRGDVVVNDGNNNTYIDLFIHDGGTAFYNFPTTTGGRIHGSVIFDNGWDCDNTCSPTEGAIADGHGLYLKSNTGNTFTADNNIIFNQFGYGIHVYSNTGEGLLENISLINNVSFDNGAISRDGRNSNIGNLGQPNANDLTIQGNILYQSASGGRANLALGAGSAFNVSGNTVIGGTFDRGTATGQS